jgi:O-antigen/teichoic acid export membrane protein
MGPAADYADFTAALALVSFFNIALGPINGTVARFSAELAARDRPGAIRTLHAAMARPVALWALVGFPLILLVGPALARALQFRSARILLLAYAMVYVTLLMSVGRGVLRGVQQFVSYNVNVLSEAMFRLVIGVLLLSWVTSAAVGLSAYLVAMALTLALLWRQLRTLWRGHAPEPMDGRAVRRFVLPMFVLMGTSAGFENLDLLVVKRCLDETQAGVYGAAFILVRAISVVATPFHILLLPLLTDLHTRGRGLSGAFLRVCAYFVLLVAGPVLLFSLAGRPIVAWLYGPGFVEGGAVLGPLALARALTYLAGLIALLYASLGRFRFLWLYVPALVLELAVLAVWHDGLRQVVWGVLAVQFLAVVGLIAYLIADRGTRVPSPRASDPGNPGPGSAAVT